MTGVKLQRGDELPGCHDFVRHCSPRWLIVDNLALNGEEAEKVHEDLFQVRNNEDGVSGLWLQKYGFSEHKALRCVSKQIMSSRSVNRRTHRLAILNIREARMTGWRKKLFLSFIYDPKSDIPSHALLKGGGLQIESVRQELARLAVLKPFP
ncbi:MAG: hypothetical protein D6694_06260 [Gammaproteobacteria bacterium]|nr:MAG: hypothetical protein D6694_06260 [Gammaproteobacteria bacterium]